MADPPPDPGSKPSPYPGAPHWVKVSAVVATVVVLLLVALVLALGGFAGHGPGRHSPGGHGDGDSPRIVGAPEVAVTADQLRFHPDRIELTVGQTVNIALTSADTLHDLVVDEIDFHVAAARNQTTVSGLVFHSAGTYVGYCSVPGHRASGMELQFVVVPEGDVA